MNIRRRYTRKPTAASPPTAVAQTPPSENGVSPPTVRRFSSKRWMLLLVILPAIAAWWTWDRFIRTTGYGVVETETLQLASPIEGVIESIRVKEGGNYEGDTLAFSVVDHDTRDMLERLQIQLRIIESRISEAGTNLAFGQADRLYARDALIAERRADMEESLADQARIEAAAARLSAELPLLEFKLTKAQELAIRDNASEDELVTARYTFESTQERLAGLIDEQTQIGKRIETLRQAVERPVPDAPGLAVSITPLRHEAELVRTQIQQLERRLQDSRVVLPASGRVLRILRHPGEYVRAGDPVISVQKSNTLRVIAFFEQSAASSISPGLSLRMDCDYGPDAWAEVSRIRSELEPSPPAIARFFARDDPLVVAELTIAMRKDHGLIPGSVVRVIKPVSLSPQSASAASYRHLQENSHPSTATTGEKQ